MANQDVRIRSEIIETELPLLIGNSTLEKARAVLDIGKKKATFLDQQVDLFSAESGHYMIKIDNPSREGLETMKNQKVSLPPQT